MSLASNAGVVVLRLLGGKRAMPDTFDALVRHCRSEGIPLIACPGHQEWDEDLVTACTVPAVEVDAVFSYLMQGGVQNFQNLFLFLSDTYFGTDHGHEAPAPLPWEGIYHPNTADGIDVDAFIAERFQPERPSIGILFYRAHWMSGNLLPIDALIRSLEAKGANVLPVYAFSLKHSPEGDGVANRAFTEYLAGPDGEPRVQCIVNTMGMSMGELSSRRPGYRHRLVGGLPRQPERADGAGHSQHRHRGRLAGQRPGPRPHRHRHECGPAGVRRAAHIGAHLLQGRSSLSSLSLRGRVRVGASPALRPAGRPGGAGGPPRHQAGPAGDEAQLGEENRRHPQQLPDEGCPHRQRRRAGHTRTPPCWC